MTDVAKNKDLTKSWVAAMNERNVDRLVGLCADDFVNHGAIPGAQGRDALPTIIGKLWKAMPDMKYACDDLIAEGDRVVCRLTLTGTQTGPLDFVRMPLPATGREVVTEHIHIFRIANGKIAEHWLARDDFGMMRQLGVGPFAGNKS